MLRGNYTARIDIKGRLKVPTEFRRLMEEKHGKDFYITSLTGECVRIYSLPGGSRLNKDSRYCRRWIRRAESSLTGRTTLDSRQRWTDRDGS